MATAALDALRTATSVQPSGELLVEERSTWQPASWLIHRIRERLAEAGYLEEALYLAEREIARTPQAPIQTIFTLLRQGSLYPKHSESADSLHQPIHALLTAPTSQPDGLLYAAASVLYLNDPILASALLERLDQFPDAWAQVINNPSLRAILSETVIGIAPHPLSLTLIDSALRRYGDAGALFVQEVAALTDDDSERRLLERGAMGRGAMGRGALGRGALGRGVGHTPRTLLDRCLDVFRYGILATPQNHRVAIAVYARAGLVDEMLQEATTLSSILEARRASGLDKQADQNLVRQVKRPAASVDADFQIHALTEAIHLLPVHKVTREQRIELANRLIAQGIRSDGWTAASAASTLVELGAIKFAIDAVERLLPRDPTRIEAYISLVRALLEVGESKQASSQTQKAWAWAQQATTRIRQRALMRGMGEVYLDYGQPETTLQLLNQLAEEPTFLQKVRSRFAEPTWNDDDLRNQALRLRAWLHPNSQAMPDRRRRLEALLQRVTEWATRLLEGEARINFYVDSLLRPLLSAGYLVQAQRLLPQVQQALTASAGDRHATRVANITSLLSRYLLPETDGAGREIDAMQQAQASLQGFLLALWQADAQRGVWQITHGIEGALSLLLNLEGPESLMAIAQAAPAIIGRPEVTPVIDPGVEYDLPAAPSARLKPVERLAKWQDHKASR